MEKPRIYYAFRSPYSRLGLHLIKQAGLDVELIPFTGPPDGIAFSDPVANPAKLAYYLQDAPRMTMRMGLPVARPKPFEADFTPANNAAITAELDGKGLDFAIAVSDARWGEGRDVSDFDVLKECAQAIGWAADRIDAAQSDEAVKNAVAAHRELVEKDKVFGVPFAVTQSSKYWGHDRFELLVEELRQ